MREALTSLWSGCFGHFLLLMLPPLHSLTQETWGLKMLKCFHLLGQSGTKQHYKHISGAFCTHPITDSVRRHYWPKYSSIHTLCPRKLRALNKERIVRPIWHTVQLLVVNKASNLGCMPFIFSNLLLKVETINISDNFSPWKYALIYAHLRLMKAEI